MSKYIETKIDNIEAITKLQPLKLINKHTNKKQKAETDHATSNFAYV